MIRRVWLLLAASLAVAPLAFSQTITNIQPPSAAAGSSNLNITINGSFPTANGTPLVFWYDPNTETYTVLNNVGTPTATQIVATVPASLMTAPTAAQIYVIQGESQSNTVEFDVTATLTSLSPNYAVEGSSGLTLTVNGAGFQAGTGVLWNGGDLETTYVSSMQLTAFVPSSLLTTPGTANVTLTVPTSPASLVFNIVGTALTLTSLSPNTTAAGGSSFTLMVNGSQYSTGTVVTWNGSPLTTTYVSTTQVTAAVPASLITLAETAAVNVTAPGQTSPSALPFTVTPTITSVQPTFTYQGGPQFTLTVYGAGYPAGTAVFWDSSALATTVVNSGELTATVPASFITNSGGHFITAQIEGLTSNSYFFSVEEPPLSLTSLSPSTTAAGSPQFTLLVNGGGFNAITQVTWNNQAVNTTYISAGQLSATIPASLVALEGTASVGVEESGENTPTPLPFTITPTITGIQPSSATAGGAQFTLTVNGVGYVSGTTVYWNSTALTTTFVNSGQLTAVVPASLIAQAGTPSITVQYSGLTSNAVTFTINAALSLTSLSPNTTTAGGAQFTLLVNGGGFTNATTVTWNGSSLATTFVSAAQLSATVPASLIALAGTASVTVVQSGQSSPTALPFTITPTITTLQPSSATAGGAQFTLTVNGAGYPAGTVAYWNSTALTTTVVNSGQLTATVPASLIASPGFASITAQTGGLTSNSSTFTIGSPPLTLTSLSPNTTAAGGAQFTLLVNGGGFTNATTVTWNGSSLATTFVSAAQLSATVPASLITLAATAAVDVVQSGQNTPPSLPFTITPTITTLQPSSATAGGAQFTLTVNGAGYPAGTVAYWNSTALTTTVVNSGQLTATVPASLIASPGFASITAQTGGLTSNSATFTIGSPPLTLTSLSPNTTAAGGAQFTLLVNGGGFTNATTVTWNGSSLATTFVSAAQLSATVPASLITLAATAAVDVVQSGQNTPPSLPFTITPTITTIQPNSAAAGGAQFTLIVNGAGYPAGTVAYWNSTALVTSVVNSGQLTASVPASLIASPGFASITAQTGGLTSNSVTFTIGSPPLTLTSLSPNTTAAGGAQFTLLVNGGGFTNATTVTWNGSSLATTFVSAAQLSATVPASLIALAATAAVDVVQSGQTTPPSLPFTVTPTITTIQPNSTAAGGAQFTLIVNGAGYPAGTVAYWNSTALVTSVVNSGQLTATVPASLIAQPGTASITAQTGGLTSNAVTFTIGSPPLTLTSLSPSTTAAGGAQFTLLVNGGGFTNATTVTWNGSSLATTFVSAAQLSAIVPASLIALAGTASVDVLQSGQSSPAALTFTITPTITSIQPNSTAAGGAQFTLTVNGAGYPAGTVVYWNSNALTTTVVNSGQLTAVVPASLIAQQGIASITAHVGTVLSNAVNFTIGAPPLTLTSLSPNTAAAGSAAFTLTANGSGFSNGTIVTWNGSPLSTTFISGAQVSAFVPANLIATVGTASVDVTASGQTSPAALPFAITQAPLALTSLSPGTTASGGPAFNLTVNGSGFTANTTVTWNGSALSTTFGSMTQLTAAIPANLIALAGTASVDVTAPGQTTPSPLPFIITQAPLSLTSLSPATIVSGSAAFSLTVNGSGFTANTTVTWNGSALSTIFGSITQLTAAVPANLIALAGTASVDVTAPGQTTPTALPFVITQAPLVLSSLSPSSTTAGNPAFNLTVNGGGFTANTTVLWNGTAIPTTFVSVSQMTASVAANLIAARGSATITAQNGNVTSNGLDFSINNPQPGITLISLSPNSASIGSPAIALTVNGSGFQSGISVLWNGSTLATTFVSSSQLTTSVPANLLTAAETAAVSVTGSPQPASLPFTISNSLLLTSISPSRVAAGGPAFTLTASGTGFLGSTAVTWNGTPLATTFVSSTQLTAAVPAPLILNAGTASIDVTAAANQTAPAALPLTIAPSLVLTSLVPSTTAAGGPAFTLTANGSGFAQGVTLFWNNTQLATTFISPTQMSAAVNANLIAQPGTAPITAGLGNLVSNALPFTIAPPAPVITSISPSTVTVGGPAFTLTVNGTGFVSGAGVSLNGAPLATTFGSGTQVTVAVPAADIAQTGTAQIVLTNPSGAASNSVTLTIALPVPTIISISPAFVGVGGPAFTLTVVGTGFYTGATVLLNGTALSTTFVSGTQLTAAVPASLIAKAGVVPITATNPGTAASNAVNLTIGVPLTITSISPSTTAAGGPAFTLNVVGTGFLSGVTVSFNSTALATTFVSATQLTAAVPANLIAQPGTGQISATNPGGAVSNAVSLTITPPTPTITDVSPPTVILGGGPITLTVTGTNFLPGTTVYFNGVALMTTFVGPTQVTAVLPPSLLTQAGIGHITATNTNGTASFAFSISIASPLPTITSISPATVSQGGPAFTLTVTGTNFVPGATVSLGSTPLSTTLISGTQLTAAVPANLILQSGALPVTVTNPGSASSNAVNLTVTPVAITSILPPTVASGGPSFTLTVNANGPVSGWTVMLNSTQLVTTTVNASQLTAVVPASLISQPGALNIVLVSPSGAQSNAATLTVTPPAPTLTSISPVSANVGDPAFTLSIAGTGFDSSSTVQWNGAPLSTTFISTTRLTAAVGPGQLAAPGTISVTVLSGLGEASNALPFTINPVTPAITTISPSSAIAGGPAFSLTVNGTGFLSLTVIQWNTTALTTHFVSATQVTADVPATLLAQAGSATVTAVNPGNVVSAALTFTINPATPAITSLSQTSATAGDAAFTLTVTGTGFAAGAVVNFGSNALATTFVSATQLTATVSANLLLLPGTDQVEVQEGTAASNAVTFTVNLPPPPALRLNPPATSAPAQQPTIDFGLNSGYPLALSGTVTLTFASNATVPSDDPSIQFASGGRTFNFTVPANTTTLPALLIQTGTVAGVITLNVTLTAAGVNVTPATGSRATITIPPSAPVIQSVTLTRSTGSLVVDINGFSTTRDMTTAVFQLTAAPGSPLAALITVPVSSPFTSWYQSAASTAFGSQFTYAQQFNVTGDSSQIVSVTVTLTNSSGTSASMTAH